ncbi:hypothetical protein QQ045_027019 [Rhodiola kirilowii]
MGKSPAKWIKSVLLGKKAPKPKIVKGKEKVANEGEVLVVAKSTERELAPATIASHLSDADSIQENLEIDNKDDESSPHAAVIPESELEGSQLLVVLDGPERHEHNQAATKVQASFRGYLARRAFLALKGIIKLQALIRGHLVRRQAVSTIHSMLGIVKLQAHVRGKRVRLSDIGLEVQGKIILETIWERKLVNGEEGKYLRAKNFPANALALKFLSLSPRPMYLEYDLTDPNSVTSWLDRWSASHFWKPVSVPMKPDSSTPLDQTQSNQSVKTEMSKAKRNNKVPSARVDNGSSRSSFEVERSRRTFRKPSSHSIEISDPEAAKSELEKVKRSLRKVHESAFPSAIEDDKRKQSPENVFSVSGQNQLEQTKSIAPEKTEEDPYDTLPTMVNVETSPEPHKVDGVIDSRAENQTIVDSKPLDIVTQDDKVPAENEDSFVKQDEQLDNENQKASMKESLHPKHEPTQNGSNKQLKVPSYMAATKSAKAKLKDLGSLAFDQETPEKSSSTRRHSLPSATVTKVSSSPRSQKLTPSNGKVKTKSDKPLSASKDGTGKADWRR